MEKEALIKEILQNTLLLTLIIRVGIVLLIIFFSRIAIQFYKYNLKLAVFYESRAYSFLLSGISDLERVKTFAEVMSTDKIDFEKESSSENKGIVELLKQLLGGK